MFFNFQAIYLKVYVFEVFMFTWQLLLWKQIHAIMQLINPNFYIFEKYESKRSRLLKKKLLQVCIFYTFAKDQDPKNGVKMRQTFHFWIFTTTCHIPE